MVVHKMLTNLFHKISLKKVAYVLLLLTYIYIIVFTYLHNRKNDGYVLGDWLVNYQDGGFKRI